MVAKPLMIWVYFKIRLNLAKIHMVAKQKSKLKNTWKGLNLAKIHMVAKHFRLRYSNVPSLNLAKIHMVAKLS